jgi:putative hydrolase of the HAD superfamily
MIEAGGWGLHVPHDLTWALEHAEPPRDHPRFVELNNLGDVPRIVSEISRNRS